MRRSHSDFGRRRAESERDHRGTPVLEDQSYMSAYSPPASSLYVMETPQHGDLEHEAPSMRQLPPVDYPRPMNNGNFMPLDNYTTVSNSSNGMDMPPGMSYSVSAHPHQRPTPTTNIRVINKDMTQQFRGRSKSTSQAKIKWFENRKSQLLGCCLTMAFLGVSIALYNYRWTGLIAGSVNTIICSSAVVITYFRKKQWHQHPNPIVHNRSVLSIFFAVCLLFNVLVDFDPSGSNDACRGLAGITEFFFFTSEAWALVMACDLFSSVRHAGGRSVFDHVANEPV